MFTASHLADFPFLSKGCSGLPPRFLGARDGVDFGVLGLADGVDCGVLGLVDGINFGVLGVASPVALT